MLRFGHLPILNHTATATLDVTINRLPRRGRAPFANGGSPPITAAQPYTNLMFDTGVINIRKYTAYQLAVSASAAEM